MIDGDQSLPIDVPCNFGDDLDDILAQKALSKTSRAAFFTTSDRLVVAMALTRPSKTVRTLRSEFVDPIQV